MKDVIDPPVIDADPSLDELAFDPWSFLDFFLPYPAFEPPKDRPISVYTHLVAEVESTEEEKKAGRGDTWEADSATMHTNTLWEDLHAHYKDNGFIKAWILHNDLLTLAAMMGNGNDFVLDGIHVGPQDCVAIKEQKPPKDDPNIVLAAFHPADSTVGTFVKRLNWYADFDFTKRFFTHWIHRENFDRITENGVAEIREKLKDIGTH